MSLASRFMNAFLGSELAHGETTVSRVARNGKAEAKSIVVREPLTVEHVEAHLSGRQGTGAIPINSKNECRFGVIDIDEYDLDHRGLLDRIDQFKLPLITCRSKSGGAHLYLFLDQWYEAKLVREYLGEMASVLGYAGRELFPKQDKILVDRGDVGNFINLPYFDADKTVRYAFAPDGSALSLEEFLDKVEATRVPLSTLEHVQYGEPREELKDYPPCLERILSQGPLVTHRNTVLFNLATGHRKASPDDWVQMLEESNSRYCPTPLEAKELVTIQKQHEKKTYGYQCSAVPLCNFCDKDLCRSRKYGIGSGGSPDMPKLSGMTILLSNPKMFFLDFDGKRLELQSEQLQSQTMFQKACIEQVERAPPTLKAPDWTKLINGLLEEAVRIEAPPELTIRGQFEQHLKDYCTSNIKAFVAEEMAMGKPWTDRGLTKFTFEGLMEFLRFRGFAQVSRVQIQQMLKDINQGKPCNGHQGVRKEDGTATTLRVWWVPEFKEAPIDMRLEKTDDPDVPF